MVRSIFVLCFLKAIIVSGVVWPADAVAVLRTWDDGAGGSNWIQGDNWSPNGVPESVDDVAIGAHANATDDTVVFGLFPPYLDTINSLALSNGADLDLNGGRITVIEDTLVGGGIGGATLSELLVEPVEGMNVDAVDTNTLTIDVGGRLTMSGGRVSVDGTGAQNGLLSIADGGQIFGYGAITLDDDNLPNVTLLLRNDGTITVGTPSLAVIGEPPARTLSITTTNEPQLGILDLDGDSNDGDVVVTRNATFELNGPLDRGIMNGDILLFGNSTLDLGRGLMFRAGESDLATLEINSGATSGIISLPAVPAVVRGEELILDSRGRIRLNSTDEVLRIESEFTSLDGTIINSGTIHFATEAAIGNSTEFQTSFTGRIVNDAGGILVLGGSGDFDTPVTNNGTLTIIGPFNAGEVQIDSFIQSSTGELAINLRDVIPGEHDLLRVEGNAVLDGALDVTLIDGFVPLLGNSFTILETMFGNISGEFASVSMPTLDGLEFQVTYNPTSVVLQVVETVLPGDYNNDNVVDAADYTVWRDNFGAAAGTLPNDVDGGVIGQAQYDTWKTHFGATMLGSGSFAAAAAQANAPEPSSNWLIITTVVTAAYRGIRYRRAR